MPLLNDSTQRHVLPQVIEALQRLQEDPGQLAAERDQRYVHPPPPYQSGHTTRSPTPEVPVVDESYERFKRRRARAKSKPLAQFKSQSKREQKRLQHQIWADRSGRRQTLPVEDSLPIKENAENNVRGRWVEQGIWADEWGPAWPKDASKGTTTDNSLETSLPSPLGAAESSVTLCLETPVDGPFAGSFHPNNMRAPGALWGHEQRPDFLPPPPEPKPRPEPVSLFGNIRTPTPEPSPFVRLKSGGFRLRFVPRPTVSDREASRPSRQFTYQIAKEREWIRDENGYKASTDFANLGKLAYESVKKNWVDDGIWDPSWDDLPGPEWFHEGPDPDHESDADSNDEEQPQPSAGPIQNAQQRRPESPRRSILDHPSAPEALKANGNSRLTFGKIFGNTELTPIVEDSNAGGTDQAESDVSIRGGSKRSHGDEAVDARPPPKRRMKESKGHSKQDTSSGNAQMAVGAPARNRKGKSKESTAQAENALSQSAQPTGSARRRSARIAERDKKRAADAGEESKEVARNSKKDKSAKVFRDKKPSPNRATKGNASTAAAANRW